MPIFHYSTIAQVIAAALTVAASQHIVVVTSARGEGGSRNLDTPMTWMSSSPFTTGAPHYDSGSSIMGYNTEPPCRSRRLEPFRQHVREECRLDAATHCPIAAMTKSATTPTYSDDVWLNSLMESVLESPSSPSTFEDPFEKIMNSMLNEFFVHMMDLETIMDGTDGHVLNSPPELKSLTEQSDIAEAPLSSTRPSDDTSASSSSSSSSSDDISATPLDEVAENSLDVLVATLAQRFIHNEEEEGKSSTADTNLPSSTSSSQRMDDLSQRLSQLGNDLLSETRTARRRRLQESSIGSEEDVVAFDRQMRVKERVARRLTEYRTDLVYHPGGTVSVYTSSFQPHSSSFFPHAIRALPLDSIVPPLGMGSTHVDECLKSRYENGDLSGSCFSAVDRFFAAVKDRNLSPPSHSSSSHGSGDEGEPWYYDFLKYACLGMMVALPFELYLCLSRKGAYAVLDNHDDNHEEGGDSFDYEMLPEERTNATNHECRAHQDEKKEKVPRVYLGVPVQVV